MEFKIIAGVLVAILTIAFYPAYIAMVNKVSSDYIVNGSLFGQGGFHANLTFKTFLNITLKAMGLGLVFTFVAFLISILFSSFSAFLEPLTASTMQPDNISEMVTLSLIITMIVLYISLLLLGLYVGCYLKVHNQVYIFKETGLGLSVRFRSSLEVNALFKILVINALLMIFTLGLAYPWAKVRKHRLLVENIHIQMPSGASGYISKKQKESPLGEELGEAFDIDIGAIGF